MQGPEQSSFVEIPLSDREATDVINFVQAEQALLDGSRFEEWMDLFTDDGFYWAPIDRDQSDPESRVSLFYDSKDFMKTRIERLRHPQIHVQIPASRSMRMSSAHKVKKSEDGKKYNLSGNYLMVEYRPGHPQQVFAGTCQYDLVLDGQDLRIKQKTVRLINSDAPQPALAVPF